MKVTAGFYWDKKGNSISYILINKKTYQILEIAKPKKISLEDFEKKSELVIKEFFNKINNYKNEEVFIEYKTYIPQYKGQHPCSESVEKQLTKYLADFDKKHKHKIKSLPKLENHKKFKSALNFFYDESQKSYVIRLLEIALHATPKRCDKIIAKLYKKAS
jgi:hypothetical protein